MAISISAMMLRAKRIADHALCDCEQEDSGKNEQRSRFGPGPASSPDPVQCRLATLRGGDRHDRSDLRGDRADAGRDARHYRTGAHGYEAGHQRVFNEVLTASVLNRLQ